jgi:hypothetical protein
MYSWINSNKRFYDFKIEVHLVGFYSIYAAITVFELLMMSGVSLETCWAIRKQRNDKFYYTVASCWLFLYDLYYEARIHEHQGYRPWCSLRTVSQATQIPVIYINGWRAHTHTHTHNSRYTSTSHRKNSAHKPQRQKTTQNFVSDPVFKHLVSHQNSLRK